MSNSLPGTVIVGLGDKAVSEAKERIRSAIKNSKLEHPKKRITINLSPANVPKDGAHFDLGMALAILQLSGQLPDDALSKTLVLGELGLDGSIRPVPGIIGHILTAQKTGAKRIILPLLNVNEAKLMDSIDLLPVRNLRELVDCLLGDIPAPELPEHSYFPKTNAFEFDMSDISGQPLAKRALEIAAAGQHNVLLSGPPGGGKTMLSRTLPSILPRMTKTQMIEATHLHSLSTRSIPKVINTPPFRAPHHSASHVSLVGGGTRPLPGEISLAHHGVLFLDEIPEFSRQALESLRQPLEDGFITVSRADATVTFPANSLVIATANPCPCGYYGDQKKQCICTQTQIDKYQSKLSGPLVDRIDLFVHVDPTAHQNLLRTRHDGEGSVSIRARTNAARDKQMKQYGKPAAKLSSKELQTTVKLNDETKGYLDKAADSLHLSSRAYMKVLRVARTIADLADSPQIQRSHLAEAIQYRQN